MCVCVCVCVRACACACARARVFKIHVHFACVDVGVCADVFVCVFAMRGLYFFPRQYMHICLEACACIRSKLMCQDPI